MIDSNRDMAPLRSAKDAVILNSDQLSIEQVISQVKEVITERMKGSHLAGDP
jgi:cytidylate kinase